MREICTYGSMRDNLRTAGESRSDALAEVRAYPTGASRFTLRPLRSAGHYAPLRSRLCRVVSFVFVAILLLFAGYALDFLPQANSLFGLVAMANDWNISLATAAFAEEVPWHERPPVAWCLILFLSAALFVVMRLVVLVGEGLMDAFGLRRETRLE